MPEEKNIQDTIKELQIKAADTLLEEPVDFTVTVANPNLLHKLKILPSQKKFEIRPLVLGTMLQIAREFSTFDFDEKDNNNLLEAGMKALIEHKQAMVNIVAYAIANSPGKPPPSLVAYLDKNLTSTDLFRLMTLVVQQMNIRPFLSALVSIGILNPFAKKTRATSQTSGEQSEASSNITGSTGKTSSGTEAGETLPSSRPQSQTTNETKTGAGGNSQNKRKKSQIPENSYVS
jgi:hypothetical protein